MSATFSITVDRTTSIVRIAMGGFFGEADVAAFRNALENRMVVLQCPPNEHLTLCDITAMDIQSQAIVELFAAIVGQRRFQSRRLAFVAPASLARMQARRLTDRSAVEFFRDADAAVLWLTHTDAVAALRS